MAKRSVPSKSVPSTAPAVAESNEDSERAFKKRVKEARALEAVYVLEPLGDSSLAVHNFQFAISQVAARVGAPGVVPPPSLGEDAAAMLADMEELALAYSFASSRVVVGDVPGAVAALLSTARRVRRLLMFSGEALVAKGLMADALLAPIRPGVGALDTATDCGQLAAVFGGLDAKVIARTPVDESDLVTARDVGARLIKVLKPKGAKQRKVVPAAVQDATDLRNRIWTLVVRGHDALWKAGAQLWGRSVDQHVPALGSREHVVKKKDDETPPDPPKTGSTTAPANTTTAPAGGNLTEAAAPPTSNGAATSAAASSKPAPAAAAPSSTRGGKGKKAAKSKTTPPPKKTTRRKTKKR